MRLGYRILLQVTLATCSLLLFSSCKAPYYCRVIDGVSNGLDRPPRLTSQSIASNDYSSLTSGESVLVLLPSDESTSLGNDGHPLASEKSALGLLPSGESTSLKNDDSPLTSGKSALGLLPSGESTILQNAEIVDSEKDAVLLFTEEGYRTKAEIRAKKEQIRIANKNRPWDFSWIWRAPVGIVKAVVSVPVAIISAPFVLVSEVFSGPDKQTGQDSIKKHTETKEEKVAKYFKERRQITGITFSSILGTSGALWRLKHQRYDLDVVPQYPSYMGVPQRTGSFTLNNGPRYYPSLNETVRKAFLILNYSDKAVSTRLRILDRLPEELVFFQITTCSLSGSPLPLQNVTAKCEGQLLDMGISHVTIPPRGGLCFGVELFYPDKWRRKMIHDAEQDKKRNDVAVTDIPCPAPALPASTLQRFTNPPLLNPPLLNH